MEFSCDSNRTAAYSPDLRWRIVYQVFGLGNTYRTVASNLNVDPSTVARVIARFMEVGGVQKRSYPFNAGVTKLSDIGKRLIIELAVDKPGLYLAEIQQELYQATGIDVSETTICRTLQKNGFTRQKTAVTALQRNELLRAQYMLDMSMFAHNPDLFVFVDEMGSDRRARERRFAYSLRGSTPTAKRLLFRGEHVTAIAAMSCSRILDFWTVVGGVTADVFDKFVANTLLPHLQPFNGINPCSIIVLDNAMIHHVGDILKLVENVGTLVYYLPPYSPDLNPIEEAFSKVKSVLKANEDNWHFFDIETAVAAAFNCISSEDCKAWVSHCGYN